MSAAPACVVDVAVVGAGPMGALHAATVARCPETRLVAVWDRHPERAARLAARFDCRSEPTEAALTIVATPAHTHLDVGLPLLDHGHVLFEKPVGLAWHDRLDDPRALVAFSERYHRGWVGRRVRSRFVAVRERISRASDVDALDDLLIHDLDLLRLHTSDPTLVGARRDGTATRASFRFSGGEALLSVDGTHAGRLQHQVDGVVVPRSILSPDPLTRQLRAVLDQIRTGRGEHRASTVRPLKAWLHEIRCASS